MRTKVKRSAVKRLNAVTQNGPLKSAYVDLLGRNLQAACKPNSVLDDHSSRRRITTPLQQPTRKFRHVHLAVHASSST